MTINVKTEGDAEVTLAERYKNSNEFNWHAHRDDFVRGFMSMDDEEFFVSNTDVRVVRELLGIKSVRDVLADRRKAG